MEENPKPRRRWFRFSLRTMLVLVALLCIYLGWAMNWKRQRDAVLRNADTWELPIDEGRALVEYGGHAPLPLRPLGVNGVADLSLIPSASDNELKIVRSLFPEATVNRIKYPLVVDIY